MVIRHHELKIKSFQQVMSNCTKSLMNANPIVYHAMLCRAWYCYSKSSVCPPWRL